MKIAKLSAVCAFFFIASSGAQAESCIQTVVDWEGEVRIVLAPEKKYQCTVYAYPGLKIYLRKEDKDPVYVSKGVGSDFLLDDDTKKFEWIQLSLPGSKDERWLKRSDALFYEDFKKVTGCFPIKKMSLDSGHGGYSWQGDIVWLTDTGPYVINDIKINGEGVRSSKADNPYEGSEGEFKTYFAKDLYVFRGEGNFQEDVFYVDYKNKKVLYQEAIDPGDVFEVEWRSEEEMKDCKTIPVVEASPPPQPVSEKKHSKSE